jgi:hypothetical protein
MAVEAAKMHVDKTHLGTPVDEFTATSVECPFAEDVIVHAVQVLWLEFAAFTVVFNETHGLLSVRYSSDPLVELAYFIYKYYPVTGNRVKAHWFIY